MRISDARGKLKPSEGYRLWNSCSPRSPDDEDRRLAEEDASGDEEASCAAKDAAKLGARNYLDVRYEDFLKNPVTVVAAMLEFAELNYDRRFVKLVESFENRDTSEDYCRYLTSDQILQVETIVGPVVRELGYRLDHGR